jgi:hypothetical protein
VSAAVAAAVVWTALAWLGIGLAFAVAFVLFGAQRVDPTAAHGTWGFRLLIVPGVAALWPILLLRWARGDRSPPEERNAHRRAARELSSPA